MTMNCLSVVQKLFPSSALSSPVYTALGMEALHFSLLLLYVRAFQS